MSGEGICNPMDETQILADIATVQVVVDDNQEDVNAIREVTDAEPILTETGGTLTTDGTAQYIYVNNAPAGVFRPVCLKIDFANQTVTETVVVRVLYRIIPGGALSVQDEVTFAGVVTHPIVNVDLEPSRYGVAVTIEKTVGTNRAYDWEIFYEEAP